MKFPTSPRFSGRSFPLRWLRVALAAVGSLQLAVVLIAIYACVLAWATGIESNHGAAAAQFAIYDSAWFTVLSAMLAGNVLCAVLIRFPWSRRQAGFLMTHLGILILLAGCLVSQRHGVEAELRVFEGRAAHRACKDSYHFRLCVDAAKPVDVPFVAGPFSWDRYAKLWWFPWRCEYRGQGIVHDKDGISLEVLDYHNEPRPSVRVRLRVDDVAEEFDLAVSSEVSDEGEAPSAVTGNNRRATVAFRQDEVDLGFQVYLHRFRQKLDPGVGMASHYSSLVDVLDRGNPPQVLDKDVLITLNAPVDVSDPRTGRTYRLFQSSFAGPWRPGQPEFDQLVGKDRSRDQVYLSRLSVNDDPGRGLKYVGCLLIVAGIVVVYYLQVHRPRKQNQGM